jgi:hypothetical protein
VLGLLGTLRLLALFAALLTLTHLSLVVGLLVLRHLLTILVVLTQLRLHHWSALLLFLLTTLHASVATG